MTTLRTQPKLPRPPGSGTNPAQPERLGVWQDRIAGRFRKITVHQLALAWWLFKSGAITKRQLRIYFAAHEMAEKRRYTRTEQGGRGARTPLYTLAEIRRLIGGSRTKKANAGLSADVKALGRIGLVLIQTHAIEFAISVDQIKLDEVTGFWSMFEQIDNRARTISMPRRTCRALAGGFQTGVMAMMIALMIRSLFWHRPGGKAGEGGYRVDGRTKCSWIASVFGVSRRSVSDARTRLIQLGWIVPIEAPQWQLNKWGQRYRLNVGAFGPGTRTEQGGASAQSPDQAPAASSRVRPDEQPEKRSGESASPSAMNSPESASPCLNTSSPSLKEGLIKTNTRTPAPLRADPAGVSGESNQKEKTGSRKRKKPPEDKSPSLHNVTEADLDDTDRLLELHDQAVGRGLVTGSEAGRLDFLALAERARAHGHSPPRLFAWLLTQRRFEFITQADEDAAAARLRVLRDGPRWQGRGAEPPTRSRTPKAIDLTDDEIFVQACIRASNGHRFEPFDLAREAKGWTRDHWEECHAAYQQKDADRWRHDEQWGGCGST